MRLINRSLESAVNGGLGLASDSEDGERADLAMLQIGGHRV